MVGITLSAEQIRGAPPEVRRWLQQEIASSLNMQPERDGTGAKTEHLVVCGPDDALAIFGAIREMPPVVNVFFELGREGENAGTQGVVAHKLVDMLHRARLQTVEQLDACLQMINRAARAARNDPGATLYVLDPRGYCLIASLTQKSILEVWRRVVASQNLANIRMAADHEAPAVSTPSSTFPELNGSAPQNAMHRGEAPSLGAV